LIGLFVAAVRSAYCFVYLIALPHQYFQIQHCRPVYFVHVNAPFCGEHAACLRNQEGTNAPEIGVDANGLMDTYGTGLFHGGKHIRGVGAFAQHTDMFQV